MRNPSGQIQWARRIVKTIRSGGIAVARSANSSAISADLQAPGTIRRGDLLAFVTLYLAIGSLGIALCLALGLWSGARAPDAILASVAALLVYAMPVRLAFAAASDGDLNANGSIDAGDAVLLLRMQQGQIPATNRADIAPLNGPADQRVDAGDAVLLLRAVGGEDVDADGLAASVELSAGASPFRRDSDADGLDDGAEVAAGTDPTNPDSDADGLVDGIDPARLNPDADGDGIVDGKDGDPLESEGQVAHWLHGDQLGSLAVVTNASGAVVRRVHYGVWGEIRANSIPPGAAAGTPDVRGKFTGQRYDDDTGYYYYGARYYDPQIGRFLQPDSVIPGLSNPQALNRYAYVLNDPMGFTDPTGNVPQWLSSTWNAFSSAGSAVYGFASDAFGAVGNAGRWAGSNLGSMLTSGYRTVSSVFRPGESSASTPGSGFQGGSQSTTGASPTSQGQERTAIVNSTYQAFQHYFSGNGGAAALGTDVQSAIINSRDQQYRFERIRTGRTSNLDRGVYGVNVEFDGAYFVGDTPIEFETLCRTGTCATTFTSRGDGFWDVVRDVDRGGPSGEIPGGTPYPFLPFSWERTFPDPRSTRR